MIEPAVPTVIEVFPETPSIGPTVFPMFWMLTAALLVTVSAERAVVEPIAPEKVTLEPLAVTVSELPALSMVLWKSSRFAPLPVP